MEKKNLAYNICKSVFALLIIIGGVAWFITGLIALVGGVPNSSYGYTSYFVIEFVLGLLIAAASIFFAARIMLDIKANKETDVRLVYCYMALFGFDLVLGGFLLLGVGGDWTIGYLWAEVVIGLAFLALALICLVIKSELKSILSLMTAATMAGYFAYSFFADASEPINVLMLIWAVLFLAFGLISVYFVLPFFKKEENKPVEDKPVEENKEDKPEEKAE